MNEKDSKKDVKLGRLQLSTTIRRYPGRELVQLTGPEAEAEFQRLMEEDSKRWPVSPEWDHHLFGVKVPDVKSDLGREEVRTEAGLFLPFGKPE